ncbi:MAG: extracellular solute-binding protein, partial [Verrucomicrobia bacterium]|nr:extracellular solute-binding protein [Verrucomicrobiota bacterium]
GSYRFFCNRDLLRTITGSDLAPQTLAEFRDLWAQVAAYSRKRDRPVMPFAGSRENAWALMNIYMGGVTNGLSRELDHVGFMYIYPRQLLWSYLRGEWSFQRPEIRAGLDLMGEFNAQMKLGYQQQPRDEAVREFLRGEALFIFAVTLEATSLRRMAAFQVDALRPPQPTKDDPVVGRYLLGRFADGNNLTYFGLYLNKRGPNKAVAVDFLRFLTSYEGNKLFSDGSGWPPSVCDVPIDPEIAPYLSPDDGYTYITNYLGCGGNTRALFQRNLHLLAGPQGSVDKFAAAFDAQMPAAVRADLRAESRAAWLAVLPQDARIAALSRLIPTVASDPAQLLRRERLEAAQNLSEARALLITRQLQLAGDGPPPDQGRVEARSSTNPTATGRR